MRLYCKRESVLSSYKRVLYLQLKPFKVLQKMYALTLLSTQKLI
jgi:hypothetical protein